MGLSRHFVFEEEPSYWPIGETEWEVGMAGVGSGGGSVGGKMEMTVLVEQ